MKNSHRKRVQDIRNYFYPHTPISAHRDSPAMSRKIRHYLNSPPPRVSREWPLPALEEPNFMWGNFQGAELHQTMKETYDKIVHWRCNIFQVPSGSAGKAFLAELARLYQAYADGTSPRKCSTDGMQCCSYPTQPHQQEQRPCASFTKKIRHVVQWRAPCSSE